MHVALGLTKRCTYLSRSQWNIEIDGSLSLLKHRIDLEERPRIFPNVSVSYSQIRHLCTFIGEGRVINSVLFIF